MFDGTDIWRFAMDNYMSVWYWFGIFCFFWVIVVVPVRLLFGALFSIFIPKKV